MAHTNEQEQTKGILWARDPDAKIPIPWHCLQRLLSAVDYAELRRPGTCLNRDYLETVKLMNEELLRTKNHM